MRTIITIGREYGSGGRLVAKTLSERFQLPFYDKKLIELAAEETGLSEVFVKNAEQQKTSSFLYNMYMSAKTLPVSDQVFIAQSRIIKRVAQEGPCVIVGRCADYVLRDHPHCLHVFIHAPLERRMQRASEEYGIDQEDVRLFILRHDKGRASYYNHFTPNEWGKYQNYDITINSAMGLDIVTDSLEMLIRKYDAAL